MLTFKKASTTRDYWQTLFLEAFPGTSEELVDQIMTWDERPEVFVRTICDDDKAIGIIVWVALSETKMYISFLAVDSNQRGQGYGSIILEECKTMYPDGIILEAELMDDSAENSEQRQQRHKFYEKNGVIDSKYIVKLTSGVYHLMRTTPNVTVDDFLQGIHLTSDASVLVAALKDADKLKNLADMK